MFKTRHPCQLGIQSTRHLTKRSVLSCVLYERAAVKGAGSPLPSGARLSCEQLDVVREHLMKTWPDVEDVSAHESCDFVCTSNDRKLFVEVKGTTGSGDSVIVTRNEVVLARTNLPDTLLAVVSSIKLLRECDPPVASGGTLFIVSPWELREDDLEPPAFDYRVKRDDS